MRTRLLPLMLLLPPVLATAATAVYIVDGDADGVADARDRCLYSPQGARVDAFGCSDDDDLDQDQVADLLDRCPNSPIGARVDRYGCAIDSDFDGIADGLDRCESTPLGAWVDAQGCPMTATAVARSAPVAGTAVPVRQAARAPDRTTATAPQGRVATAPIPTVVATAPLAISAPAAPRSVLAAMRPVAATASPVFARTSAAPATVASAVAATRPERAPMMRVATADPAPAMVAPRAIPVPPPPIRARPTTLNAGSRVAEVPFEGGGSRLNADGDSALREVLTAVQSRLGESADYYVELVGLTSGGRGDSGLMAQRVSQVQTFMEAQGIPAARIVYALRPARRGEQAGRVELHQR